MNIEKNKDSHSLVFKMSLPIFVELLLQMLVGNVDQIMISHYSQNSVAAIGNANQILNIIIIVLSVMSVATTILISRYLGANDKHKISEVFNTSLCMLAVVSVFITGFLFVFHEKIFEWMKVPALILHETSTFLLIVSAFVIIQGLYMAFTASLRSYGMMKQVMIAAAIMNLFNILGNAVLINGLFGLPALGIVGSAISTNLCRCLGLGMVIWLFKKKTDVKISSKYLKPFPWKTLKDILYLGVPSGAEELSYNLSQTVIMKFVNLFGTVVITTKVYCSMFANVAYVYSISLSQASQIVVSYLMGAGLFKKIITRVWATIAISMAISVGITIILWLNSDAIFGLLTQNQEILKLGKQIIFVEIFLEIGRSINIVMVKSLLAVDDVKFPAYMCVFSAWLFGVGFGWFFGVHLGYGLVGIWWAMAFDECFRGTVFLFRFGNGLWRRRILQKKKLELYENFGWTA